MDIGSILLRRGLLDLQQLETARALANGKRVDQIAIEMGFVPENDALSALGDELGLAYVDLREFSIETGLLAEFPTSLIFRHVLLPLYRKNNRVVVATSDPFDLESLNELASASGQRLIPVLAARNEIERLIKDQLGLGGDTVGALIAQQQEEGVELLDDLPEELGELAQEAQTASVIRLVNELLVEALAQESSDIHIEPQERGLTIRYRVDGLLRVQPVPAEIIHFQNAIITRLKIMARLNIAEKRRPQDGRIKLKVSGREIDVRVSVIPMLYGEGIVMRLLDKERMRFDLHRVGMPPEIESVFREMIALPHGIILVTGPTGSGKTSTLYSALNAIKTPEIKIITVEDPVEYHTEGISQIQVHSKVGLTFAAGLRSILRHDPDVVLIGEIRDGETAQAAIQASLTGHLVFSTLHTNDAPGAFTRLIDMDVEPYLVASTVEGVLAQRLIRKLCQKCRKPFKPGPEDIPPGIGGPLPEQLWQPVGCRACRETGYSGRTGIFELLRSDETTRRLCVSNATSDQIRQHARSQGMVTLRENGWSKACAGITSVDEVKRITKGDID